MNPIYQLMLNDGHSKEKIDQLLKLSKKAFGNLVKGKYIHEKLVAHCCLQVKIPLPKKHGQYKQKRPQIHISQIKDTANNTYLDAKGFVVNAYEDNNRISIIITDMKNMVRANLFGSAISKYKDKDFHIGDIIKMKNVSVRTYKGINELRVNEYSSILHLKNKNVVIN